MISANYNFKYDAHSLSFQGVSRADKALGEAAVKYVKSLNLTSSTKLASRYWDLEQNGVQIPRELNQRIVPLINKTGKSIEIHRFNNCSPILSERAATRLRLGNCGEMATIAKNFLTGRLGPIDIVTFDIDKSNSIPRYCCDHCIAVARLNKGHIKFDINKPHSWGKDAMIIDPWTGIVDSAQQGLLKIKGLFRITDEKLKFMFY